MGLRALAHNMQVPTHSSPKFNNINNHPLAVAVVTVPVSSGIIPGQPR